MPELKHFKVCIFHHDADNEEYDVDEKSIINALLTIIDKKCQEGNVAGVHIGEYPETSEPTEGDEGSTEKTDPVID